MVIKPTQKTSRPGAAAVEAALVLSLFLLLIFGIYEYGRLVMMKHLLDNAAREGSRYAVVHTQDKTTSDIQTWVMNRLVGQDAYLQNVNIQAFMADNSGKNIGLWTNSQFGQYISVQIEADYSPVLPSLLFMNSTIHLLSNSTMYSEAN
jgi:Flp pilus assembly protein TadG